MDSLIAWDKALFIWLNSLGTPTFDGFWIMMTHRASNVVVYLVLWLLISWKTSWKKGLYLLLFTGLLILVTDQFTNLFKVNVGRLRPCYDEEIKSLVRLVKPTCGGRFSFFSGHASNSFALAIFFGGILKFYLRYLPYILLFIAALIAYSRVYIGVHFPLDILSGALFGSGIGYLFFKLWIRFVKRFLS
ncbi:phosphatase PAP2 family protein [Flavobacteriaceae bacterium]|nr:phosphatase PAP2 family protein [Flavobacteriaceae bacterium]